MEPEARKQMLSSLGKMGSGFLGGLAVAGLYHDWQAGQLHWSWGLFIVPGILAVLSIPLVLWMLWRQKHRPNS